MPFTKHIIEPINIAQCPIPTGEPNELECLSNLTLANVIRQLSSLGQHAGRLFDELVQDAVKCQNRLQLLDARMHSLKTKCTQLDIQNEEVSVDDAKNKKQFKSSVKLDQQVVSRRTMPDSIRLLYEQADPPPALDKLNPYRTDGKDCMKFYTDPGFFFNIWANELMKDNETRKNEKKKRKSRGDKQTPKSAGTAANSSPYADPNVIGAGQKLSYTDSPRGAPPVPAGYPQIYAKSPPIGGYYINEQDDGLGGSLPPPPPPHLTHQSSMEIYAESSRMNNGSRGAKLNIQQAVKSSQHYAPGLMTERPLLPPPPVPTNDNHVSDLQQIQQQIIRKFDGLSVGNSGDGGNVNDHGGDLPPPPPIHGESNGLPMYHHPKIVANTNHSYHPHDHDDMPLPPPPPPMDLLPGPTNNQFMASNPQSTSSNPSSLPPPPPLPPLVEPDTTSSSNSSLSATGNNGALANSSSGKSGVTGSQTVGRSFLDDINKGRFVLKPTQKETLEERQKKGNSTPATNDENGRDIQPFVKDSDVAAIIDFVRKFRPHVCDSSEDEENSDWDE